MPYANSNPPPPPTSFHQPKAYLTAPTTTSESSWFADSGASHHVTAEHSNILQHSDSAHAPDQLYVGNGKGVTKEVLHKGKARGGIYCFENLVIPRTSTPATNSGSSTSL
ncbi:hypothetical protein PIB30_003584 [Stylosanthes scabra]|uniref:Uncharacterized protein n=1 Tax=Stylosanthes scabra TaxID=79078 RepID=A0ABU6X5H6_9FABA|nr:hypothetical protein [Stylosanthes scabra]